MLMHFLVEDNVRVQMRGQETIKKNFINFYEFKKKNYFKKRSFFFWYIIKDSDNNIIKTPLKAIFIINMSILIFFLL
jgi:hypothetical protein